MKLADLRVEFPWGVLLVTDATSTEEIPTWASDEEQVTAASTALVMRVRHQDEGDVLVSVWDDPSDVRGGLAFSGQIEVPSGLLKIADALGTNYIQIPGRTSPQFVEIFADSATEATDVHVVLKPSDMPG